jgi:tetratricopeptide (TPR) repeat protein
MNQAQLITLLQQGVELHRRGALQEAAVRYGQVLRGDPRNPDALYLIGTAAFQQRRFADAAQHLGKAIAVTPQRAAAQNLLGLALSQLGRLQDALASFDRALALEPGSIDFLSNRANALNMLRRFQESTAAYDRILAVKPDHDTALFNRSLALHELGRHDEALASIDRAIALQRGDAMVHVQRGDILRALSRVDEAITAYERAIAMQPMLTEAHVGRAIALNSAGRRIAALASCDRALQANPASAEAYAARAGILMQSFDAAEDALVFYDRALNQAPGFHIAHSERGVALQRLGRLPEALVSVQRALEIDPNYARGYLNRAIVLDGMGRTDDAFADCQRALAIEPELAGAFTRRATMQLRLGRIEEARADYEHAFSLDPNDFDAAFDLATVQLLMGEWSTGWPLYERRSLRNELHYEELLSQPRWTGEPPDGRPLILLTDQGLGDAIQSVRYVPMVAERGHQVSIVTAPVLAPLLRSACGAQAVATTLAEITRAQPAFRWAPMMSMPAVFSAATEPIPATVPYLVPDARRVAEWSERLGRSGFKIGIAWQGNPRTPNDKGRSIALSEFEPLADIPDVRLISVQKRDGIEQIGKVRFGGQIETPLDPNAVDGDALVETAAVMMNLDLFVTSDAMVAHLAGALGCRTFVALRRIPDWRWMLDRSDSPWYPTMRLFRQTTEGNWREVFREMLEVIMRSNRFRNG